MSLSRRVSAVAGFLFVALQCWLLLRIADRFRIENTAFQRLLMLTLAGFVVHHWLRPRFRLPFFLALSMAGLLLVFGIEGGDWNARTAALRTGALVGIGLALIGMCHLPIAVGQRVLLLLGAGALLAFFRGGPLGGGELAAMWPILGSMFMFRLIVYVYDLQHKTEPPSFTGATTYFFMLPNVCFPLFPVVDYKTFRKTHYNDDALRIYQRGLNWMMRGIVQLILYRLVYHHVYIDADRVSDGTDLVRHLVSNFALYLRVSGQFHLIIGTLHLYGFNLPETNRYYFLAESFTDFWRRVNVYFKDFLMKVVYYPVAFRLKRLGTMPALLGATAIAFVTTWFLHAYQWFWLRGSFSLTSQDAAFWTILGVLVTLNSIWEERRGRQRTIAKRRGWRRTSGAAVRAAATFGVIASLWSLWSAHSWDQWFTLWSFADFGTLLYGGLTLAIVAAAVFGVEAMAGIRQALFAVPAQGTAGSAFPFRAAMAGCVVPALLLYAAGSPRVQARLGPQTAFVVDSLRSTGLNAADLGRVERGYYENLLEVSRFNLELNSAYMNKPAEWLEFFDTDLWQPTNDRRYKDLVPRRHEVINGTKIGTNRWGMRDRDYEQAKTPGTYRIAMLGSSHVMGWGVDDGQTFEEILEEKLNSGRKDGRPVECLNFGVPGYSPYCQIDVLEKKALAFSPDAIFMIAHLVDPSLNVERLALSVREGIDLRDDYLRQLVIRAGIDRLTPELWARRRMIPFTEEFTAWTYQRIAEIARVHGALPVWVYMPRVSEGAGGAAPAARLMAQAKAAGFEVVDLSLAFQGEEIERIAFKPWDLHPNALGHEIFAGALYEALQANPRLSFLLGEPPGAARAPATER